jgi:hypothetical protein
MKKNIIKTVLMLCFVIVGQVLLAQGPPNPPADPSLQGPPVGGGAPIGGGIEILLLMAVGYGTRKTYKLRMRKNELNKNK